MNAATRARKQPQQSTDEWLWADLPDPYADIIERHDPSKNSTGVDFVFNKHRELTEHPNEPTRIDLMVLSDGTAVKRIWLAGWETWTPAFLARPLEDGWTVETAAKHLESDGWTVRRWQNEQGQSEARAFRCGLRCVRTLGYRHRWEERNGHFGNSTNFRILDSRFDG